MRVCKELKFKPGRMFWFTAGPAASGIPRALPSLAAVSKSATPENRTLNDEDTQ